MADRIYRAQDGRPVAMVGVNSRCPKCRDLALVLLGRADEYDHEHIDGYIRYCISCKAYLSKRNRGDARE